MKRKATAGNNIPHILQSLKLSNKGLSIAEVLIAALLFSIMVIGMSQLLSAGLDQQQLDLKQQLAALAVNNGAERFLSTVRDNCGTASFTGSTIGGCSAGGGDTYSTDYTGASATPSPIPPDLMTICPNCKMEVRFTCDSSQKWQGYVRLIDTGNSSEILASVTPEFYQPLRNL